MEASDRSVSAKGKTLTAIAVIALCIFLAACGKKEAEHRRPLISWEELARNIDSPTVIQSLDELFPNHPELVKTLKRPARITIADPEDPLVFGAFDDPAIEGEFKELLSRFDTYWAPYACAFHTDFVLFVEGPGSDLIVEVCTSCDQILINEAGSEIPQVAPAISYEFEDLAQSVLLQRR